jgi:phage repressor protein C with HTH and peptisase S24 domain
MDSVVANPPARKTRVTSEHREEARRLKVIWDSRAKLSQDEFGAQFEIGNQSAVGQFLRGVTPLSPKAARGFASGLGCLIDDFSPRLAAEAAKNAAASGRIGTSASVTVRPVSTYKSLDELPPESTVLITRIDITLSAGSGRDGTWYIEERDPLPFEASYISKLHAKPKNLVAVKVSGSSMEPRLFDGDTVVVDKADQYVPADGAVFALVYAGQLLVKRLYALPGGAVNVTSDNPAFRSFDVRQDQLDDISIIGRVKYRSGTGDF